MTIASAKQLDKHNWGIGKPAGQAKIDGPTRTINLNVGKASFIFYLRVCVREGGGVQ